MSKPDLLAVKRYFTNLQNSICLNLEQEDGKTIFAIDNWQSSQVSSGSTRVAVDGNFIEQAAVNFSAVASNKLPPTASARYPELAGAAFEATGISLIIHPKNPYVPTTHANVRFFIAYPENSEPVWWFGGGYDLTPYYAFEEDCIHWHTIAKNACDNYGLDIYPRFKKWCDEYFFLPHRNETRGIGGLFFDDVNCWDFQKSFNFIQDIGNSFIPAYLPIVQKRKNIKFTERERDFQLYRRGRYVEFNLVYDRGTLFGLQSKGRTESILASLPPQVNWRYNWQPDPDSAEAKLYEYLQARDWGLLKLVPAQ